MNNVDIILITCNRLHFLKRTIDALHDRIKTPFNLIVVDNNSKDGTVEYLKEQKGFDRVDELVLKDKSEWCSISNQQGLEVSDSEWVITMQDDIIVPKLDTCVVQKMIDLMEKYPEYGAMSLRIQRIPNMDWNVEGEIVPIRKALASYFRIHRRSDLVKAGGFGTKRWEATGLNYQMSTIDKKCGWIKDIWCDHIGYCWNRGFPDWYANDDAWPYKDKRQQDYIKRPYPFIDQETCVPLDILNADKKVDRPVNSDRNFFGFKMRTRRRYYDEKILMMEMDPERDIYRIPKNSRVVIDIGSHIGGTALVTAKKGAEVFAFEPELYNYETLCYNVRRNRLQDKIHCLNLGVGKPGRTKLYVHDSASGTTSSYTNQFKGREKEVPHQVASFISIKDVFKDYDIEHCDLLKIDNEGGEEDIIRDFDEDLANRIDQISLEFHSKPVIMELVTILSKWYEPENTMKYEWVFRRKSI